MNNKFKYIVFILLLQWLPSQIIEEHAIVDENGNQLDVFAYQLPENYNANFEHPLLVAFHQWGGNHLSTFSTQFDDEAYSRGWIFMSPYGGSSNNYNHQDAQEWVKLGIQWLMENYNVDYRRIYMVGGSMGGAAGAIYANNHLNPTEPMVAATASASGILDCERRAIEMDGNNSMTEWFGGNYDEVPFEYHRNSAVYFADSTQSMHYNLQYTPLYLDFGVSEPHRTHAEDLYDLLLGYNENMWIETNPIGSHGFSVMDEAHTCDWLSVFELVDSPNSINVNIDEPGRVYWIEARNQINENEFIRLNINSGNNNNFYIYELSNADSIIFHNTVDFNSNGILINHETYIDEYYIGLTGNEINFIDEIEVTGIMDDFFQPLNINIQNQIVWISVTDFEYDSIGINFSFSSIDVNQDGIWDILDIVLTVNFIMGNINPSELQFESADLNGDHIIDVLDIVTMVNIIMGE
jgi:pimeloyl-ACP methyl ester carboxylesterase